ncbi:uncharacterized protein E0L32_010938 [Thyridium curvatum]|uniref:beta-glucosidase n=1 Tax=Thyridium curvatum TaxID=1093900 RepID=A0A507AJS6_9PEZI|nr:uncharacterized protein E0L32_010938 [Thyridium curvatum]TPX07137.1 hypothetical protein E0L32_010938 [Thyridium curvatum]
MMSFSSVSLAALLFACGLGPVEVSGASLRARDAVPAGFVAAPYYPTPHGGWDASWAASYQKAKKLVEQMTLAEKVNITSGTGLWMGNTGSAPRLGFPQLCLQDSALGVRSTDHVTAFPAGITTGATWDKDLMYARAVAIGQEFRGKGANIYLGPTVGPLGRKPRGGRNWEGFGADPVLQAVGGALTIKGVQEQGVIATLKHLVGNEQEMFRMYNVIQPGTSANIDDRTLHELYLWPFAEGVRAGVGSIMCSYNAVNGSAACQNSYLQNGVLKDELGFQGFVMSDWLAQISGVPAALAGLDMSMPGDTMIPLFGTSYWMYELTRSVLNGSVPVDRLDDMTTRIVAAWYQLGQDKDFGPPNFSANTDKESGPLYPAALFSPSGVVNHFVDVRGNHAEVARQVAQDAITLLKNDGDILPFSKSQTLSVFGTDAAVNPDGPNACGDRACNKGTLGMGWGSGTANYATFDDPIGALRRRTNVTFYNTDSFPNVPEPGADDVAVVFLSSDSGENQYTVEGNNGDRNSAGLKAWHNGDELVKRAAARYKNVVVVVHTVGPLVLEPWVGLPSVKAVLFAHLPGQEAGESLASVLFGDVSPSGHLPYSIPVKEDDYPDSLGIRGFAFGQPQDTFSEGLYIDYRWLNRQGTKPRYAFGHGLSYTAFNLSRPAIRQVSKLAGAAPPPASGADKSTAPVYDAAIPPAAEAYEPGAPFDKIWRYLYSWLPKNQADDAARDAASGKKYPYPAGYSGAQRTEVPAAGGAQGGNPALWDVAYEVTATVTNAGDKHAGKAVVQAYVQFPEGTGYDTPVVQLRDFAKTAALKAGGGSAEVKLQLTRKDLSVWDVVSQNWVVPDLQGRYKIWIGESSDALFTACYTDTLKCESGLASPV